MLKHIRVCFTLVFVLATGLFATAQTASTASQPSVASTGKDLAASAMMSQDHTVLVQALQAAGLTSQAKGAGPYTIFAPTNGAFGKLPSGALENLLKPSSKKQLTGILATHVVEGRVMAADLQDGQTIKTVSGETLTVSKQGGTVMIKDAKGGSATVTKADIQATNGIVHSVDTVLMPSK